MSMYVVRCILLSHSVGLKALKIFFILSAWVQLLASSQHVLYRCLSEYVFVSEHTWCGMTSNHANVVMLWNINVKFDEFGMWHCVFTFCHEDGSSVFLWNIS